MSKEAMKLALEALEDTLSDDPYPYSLESKAITALREALAQERSSDEQSAQQEPVLQDIEQYRLQMAGISTAAIGYWKEGDGILPDYDTIALRDVAKLYKKYDELYKAQNVPHGIIAGALFDFMGWLTTRPKRIMLSSVDDASPAADAIKDFAKMRGLSLDDAQVQNWQEALAEQPAQQEPEMPYTVIAGELDCSHAEELCKKLTETKGCWHTIIGTGQLKQDGSPAAWSCVMCGTSFAPKMSEKSLIDLYQVGFNNGRKSAEILSPKKHPQPAQEPVAWRYLTQYKNQSVWTYCAFEPTSREKWEALYTSPPAQRTWVGLTDEEIQTEWVLTPQNDRAEGIWFGRRIEAKLKEKNT